MCALLHSRPGIALVKPERSYRLGDGDQAPTIPTTAAERPNLRPAQGSTPLGQTGTAALIRPRCQSRLDPAATLDHSSLKALAKQLRRPLYTLAVTSNDPFTAGVTFRRTGAEWFQQLWQRLGVQPGAYLHRIHYLCVSQKTPILMPNGEEYQNTEKCEAVLDRAALDARYLGLLPPNAIIDRRNPDPS